jgi:hypothetical protein
MYLCLVLHLQGGIELYTLHPLCDMDLYTYATLHHHQAAAAVGPEGIREVPLLQLLYPVADVSSGCGQSVALHLPACLPACCC